MRRALLALDGVNKVGIHLSTGQVTVESDSPLPLEVLAEAVRRAGYDVL